MSAGHTAGPWEYDGNCAGYVRASSLPDQPAIARAYSRDDAFLIAAAPDLLSALIAVRARFQDLRLTPDHTAVLERVDAAITRATGEQP